MIAFTLALLAVAAPPADRPSSSPSQPAAAAAVAESEVTRAARDWLALVEAREWQGSWAATGASFRALNTPEAWRSAAEQAHGSLGRTLSRTLLSDDDVPAPPKGYRVVRFRTDFERRAGVTETLSLDREGDAWKVVGVYID